MTEPPFNPKSHRARTCQLLFESFHVPAFYLVVQSVLALYASGKTTGIVLDIGEGVSHAVPVSERILKYYLPDLDFQVYESTPIYHATQRLNVAGRGM